MVGRVRNQRIINKYSGSLLIWPGLMINRYAGGKGTANVNYAVPFLIPAV